MPPDYMSTWYSGCQASQSSQIGLINQELSYIYVSELKVAAFTCQVDDLVVPIWPYQFFNAVRSDRWSEPNTVHCKYHANVSVAQYLSWDWFLLNFQGTFSTFSCAWHLSNTSFEPMRCKVPAMRLNVMVTVWISSATPDLFLIQWFSEQCNNGSEIYLYADDAKLFSYVKC